MKLVEALNLVKKTSRHDGELFECFLVSGFNSLHLNTFLAAELSLLFPDRKLAIKTGLYGDVIGNLARLAQANSQVGVVLLEWPDLDARLGIRSSGTWSPAVCADILETVKARCTQIEAAVKEAAARRPVIVSFPSLPLLPTSFTPGWQASSFEAELSAIMSALRSQIAGHARVRILSSQRLDIVAPLSARWDIESELQTGFPYQMSFASILAGLLAQLIRKPAPKKGLITDLDDTLWRGIVGEVGVDGISWHLDQHTQIHAFYQKLLDALAAEGVLLAVASKNERSTVEAAFGRRDLALAANHFFPLEVSWGPKSDAVTRILKTWNVGADSVVFVDDSPLELAEVKAAHPDVECIQFPTKDSAAVYQLALRLRDLFGRTEILEEDTIRAQSIRRTHTSIEEYEAARSTPSDFLNQVHAEIGLNFAKTPQDPRALELVNKTNQFNLNGKRYTEAAWQSYLEDPASFLLVASYTDKFGPLGKIAVVAGKRHDRTLTIDSWVMSCRAFSRRIEHKCLQELFAKFAPDQVKLDFAKTERNGPLCDFLEEMLGEPPAPGCSISREAFETLSRPSQVPQGVVS